MGAQRVLMKGAPPWLVRWASRAGPRDFYPAVDALVSLVKNTFFLAAHFFSLCVPNAQQPGQAVVTGRLSPNMCLWLQCMKGATVYIYKANRNDKKIVFLLCRTACRYGMKGCGTIYHYLQV
jgi:hypothetical protein